MKSFFKAVRIVALTMGPACGLETSVAGPPYQATGLKVGEVTDATAIVWTRLTRNPQRNSAGAPMVELITEGKPRAKSKVVAVKYPEGKSVADIRDAVPGAPGEVRVVYKTGRTSPWLNTDWAAVDPDRDFTQQFVLKNLQPNSRYYVTVESRGGAGGEKGQSLEGRFRTAPAAGDPARVVFTVSTGQAYGDRDDPDGYRIYPAMLKLRPSFFVHTGDIVYYDGLAKTAELARYHWQRTYSLPSNVQFHRQVTSYFIKDDHDAWQNDCWPTMKNDKMFQFTFAQGLAIFPEQVPMGESTYRTRRWGRDLQIWMVEGRDYRSANPDPDGPDKTIWGAKQKAWFKRTVRESDATFRLLISPTPLVGPDRKNKNDNHSNQGFTNEGDELREFIAGQENMAVICGDRHWQYVSVHPKTGVREYSCGPASDKHAGGWKNEDFVPEYHRYLKVKGGFLSATIERIDGKPRLTFRHHDVDGNVNHHDRLVAE